MNISTDLAWRGLIKDKTFGDDSWLDTPRTFYLGIDASSESLTIGNLAVILLARRLVEGGWKAVLLAGGATSLVGDPGGKEDERELKSKEEIEKNVASVSTQIEKLFAGQPHEMVNNLDWFGDVKYLDFLRDVGKHYSMTELMQRDFVTARMGEGGSGISYAEFSYSLLQGYDFWWLFKNKGVELQIGASDQWGNMLSGVPLIRKKEGAEVHALSMPLVINKETGVKFGKSEEGAVWLDPAKTSPADFYQFWINVSDEDVEEFLKIYTFLSKDEIEKIMGEHNQDKAKRAGQKQLATEATKIVHGEDGLSEAIEATDIMLSVSPSASPSSSSGSNYYEELESGVSLIEALVKSGLASSNSEARRLVDDGGVYLNNDQADKDIALKKEDFDEGKVFIRRGKKFQNTKLILLK